MLAETMDFVVIADKEECDGAFVPMEQDAERQVCAEFPELFA
jgi:hypothetical protein